MAADGFEATLLIETEIPIPFTCDNATGIEKGTVLTLSDPMTVAAASSTNGLVAGIAAEEKIASDGKTTISVYRGGIFKMTCSGAVSVGDMVGQVVTGAAVNHIGSNQGTVNISGARILGTALETGADDETIKVELKPITNSMKVA